MEHTHKIQTNSAHHRMNMESSPYKNLLLMIILSFAAMYILMYAMVNSFSNVINNVNQIYMAGLMTTPMVIIELLVMRNMYTNKLRNVMVISLGVLFGVLFYLGIRNQAFVQDKQFLKSMIPHHAAAILMVKEAKLNDPEVKRLGNNIIKAQQQEIDWMKAKIKTLENK